MDSPDEPSFVRAAVEAGCSEKLARLLYQTFATQDHTHWADEIGMEELPGGEVETLEDWAGNVDGALAEEEEAEVEDAVG